MAAVHGAGTALTGHEVMAVFGLDLVTADVTTDGVANDHSCSSSSCFSFTPTRRAQDVSILIHNQTVQLVLYYRFYCKYPSPVDSFEDAVNIHMGFPAEEYVTSAFWGTMLKWLVLMEQKELYGELQPFLAEDLESVTKCVWFLRADEESALYDAYAMNMAGDGVAFEPNKSYEDLKEQITFVMDQYAGEMFSFEKYSFDTLEFIVSRYYGYLVRVKKEHPVG